MVVVVIRDVPIDFPYEPYPCQIEYMRKVVDCLNQKFNGVLESPTGTGKTLCLLCACLGWVQSQRELNNAKLSSAPPKPGGVNQTKPDADLVTSIADFGFQHRIVYTSRTHSQLTQVVKELNKTVYWNKFRVTTLGSREQMCIHSDVVAESNTVLKNHACRAKLAAHSCQFHRNLEKMSGPVIINPDGVPDIEEVVAYGKKHTLCPFYLSRNLQEKADLILMPYNYILDPSIRRNNKVELQDAILIFDEAHNLQKICEDVVSISFSTKDLALCLTEAKSALDLIQKETEDIRKEMDECGLPFQDAQLPDAGPSQEVKPEKLGHLIVLLHNLEKELQSIKISNPSCLSSSSFSPNLPGVVKDGSFLVGLLTDSGLDAGVTEDVNSLINDVVKYLSVKHTSSIWNSRGVGLAKLSSLLSAVYSGQLNRKVPSDLKAAKSDNTNHFKTYLCRETSNKPSFGRSSFSKPPSNSLNDNSVVINYWCFSAGPGMKQLLREKLWSILVTSGTLTPVDQFADEMQIPFEVRLENGHVITREQILPMVMPFGPGGHALNGVFRNRSSESYLNGLFNAIVNFCRLIPQGCLVFFASYSQMTTSIDAWKEKGWWKRLEAIKSVFVERKGKMEFAAELEGFRTAVAETDGKGAVFFGVCRGKISEGVDFSDNQCRAAMIAGIPFPPMMEAKVLLKKTYLDERKQAGDACLSGDAWYRMEAVRAVNQAIGRTIRHKEDFGAVILLDDRFSSWPEVSFPAWIRPHLVRYSGKNAFGQGLAGLAAFYKSQKSLLECQMLRRKEDLETAQKLSNKISRREKMNENMKNAMNKNVLAPNVCSVDEAMLLVNQDDSLNDSWNTERSPAPCCSTSSRRPPASCKEPDSRGLFGVLHDQNSTSNSCQSYEGMLFTHSPIFNSTSTTMKRSLSDAPTKQLISSNKRKKIVIAKVDIYDQSAIPEPEPTTSSSQPVSRIQWTQLKPGQRIGQFVEMKPLDFLREVIEKFPETKDTIKSKMVEFKKSLDVNALAKDLSSIFLPTYPDLYRSLISFVPTKLKKEFKCVALKELETLMPVS